MSKRDKHSPIGNVIGDAVAATFSRWLDRHEGRVLEALAGADTPGKMTGLMSRLLSCPQVRAAVMQEMRPALLDLVRETLAVEVPHLLDALAVERAGGRAP